MRYLRIFFKPLIFDLVNEVEQDRLNKKIADVFSRLKSYGSELKFNGDFKITHPEQVVIGDNVHIGQNAYFRTKGGLTIGDNTHISRNVTI